MYKGTLKIGEEGVIIYHDIIDPYSQITNPIPLHPGYNSECSVFKDLDGKKIDFKIVLLGSKHYASLEFNVCTEKI